MSPMREPEGDTGVCSYGAERRNEKTPELLKAIRNGDASAFETVAREHSRRLYRLAMHLTGKPEDAEDLVQETLVRTLPALGRFEGRASLSTYLFRALTNIWKNRLRSRSRSRIVDWFRGGGKDLPDRPDPSPSPEERIQAGDRAGRVRAAVARLEPNRRLTILLRELEELSYEEIADMTGVPVGTVRSRLARAREDLRKILGGRA
jgi:RNA polymerase sigma-70 factor (ECF subfamily)